MSRAGLVFPMVLTLLVVVAAVAALGTLVARTGIPFGQPDLAATVTCVSETSGFAHRAGAAVVSCLAP